MDFYVLIRLHSLFPSVSDKFEEPRSKSFLGRPLLHILIDQP